MDIESIRQFLEPHLEVLRNIKEVEITSCQTGGELNFSMWVEYKSKPYDAEIQSWSDNTFAVNILDLENLEIIFSINECFQQLEDLEQYLKKIEQLFTAESTGSPRKYLRAAQS